MRPAHRRRRVPIWAFHVLVIVAVTMACWSGIAAARTDGPQVPPPDRAQRLGACRDDAYNLLGGAWMETVAWTYHAGSTPASLGRTATIRALRRAMANIVGAQNDCGRADHVLASASFLGQASHRPSLTPRGGCGANDGHNAVGFGRLPDGVAGLTCVWMIGGRIIEADVMFNRRSRWATSKGACSDAFLLESVATHEFGHLFGLDHVSEAKHGRLTMSPRLDALCGDAETTLGLGDMLGLEHLYGD